MQLNNDVKELLKKKEVNYLLFSKNKKNNESR